MGYLLYVSHEECWKRGQRKNRIHAEKVKVVVENGGAEMTRKAVNLKLQRI